MIISFLNQKGGVGKTTICINIAFAFKQIGFKVLLVDSDPQGSARDWHSAGDGDLLDVIGLDRPTLDKDVKKLEKQYDIIFIDGAPQLSSMATKAIICSDMVLIPVQPSPYDIWASEELVSLVKQRQEIAKEIPKSAFIISRQIAGTIIGNEVRDALKDYNLPVFKNGTFQRVAYAVTASQGKTVAGYSITAKKEINLIRNEIIEFLDLGEIISALVVEA